MAETDDELLAKYLEEGSLAEPEMLKALHTGITQGKIIPVLCAAATKNIGSHALLDLIVHEFPSPVDRGEVPGTDLKSKQAGVRAPDPKAPKMTWVHWVVYDIPANVHELPENAARKGLPPGAKQGLNDWKRADYGGPCPPIGTHRYFFKLYALDVELPDLARPTKAQLLSAMEGHVLEQTELVGTYKKK